MIVHEKTYRLRPETGCQCAWRIRIIDLDRGQPGVHHLRPIIVIAQQTGPLISLTSCANSIGDEIRRDFALDINRVLWIEQRTSGSGRWLVARFKPRPLGARLYYDISWRPMRENERRILRPYLPEMTATVRR